jgi:superoxide dismutase, Fe-Mn family
MVYEQKNFDNLLGTEGFSDLLLKNHFQLYGGYVKRTNASLEKIRALPAGAEQAELRRRLGWEWNGMRLHELYFGNMVKGGKALDQESSFAASIVKEFGSFDAWKADFLKVAGMPGIGWVALVGDKEGHHLMNIWVNEHDVGHLAGCKILLVMDVFEHAFITDYGLQKGQYIEAFFNAVNWGEVASRLS